MIALHTHTYDLILRQLLFFVAIGIAYSNFRLRRLYRLLTKQNKATEMIYELTHIPEGMTVNLLSLQPPSTLNSETTTEMLVGVTTKAPKLRFLFELSTDLVGSELRIHIQSACRQTWYSTSDLPETDGGVHGWVGDPKEDIDFTATPPWEWFQDEHYKAALHLAALYTLKVLEVIDGSPVKFAQITLTVSTKHMNYAMALLKEACRDTNYTDERLAKYGARLIHASNDHDDATYDWSKQFGMMRGRSAESEDIKEALNLGSASLQEAMRKTREAVQTAANSASKREKDPSLN